LIENRKVKLIFSNELIEEFLTVAKRPKFTRYFSDADINNILRLFKDYGKLIKVKSNITECRDLKDNFLLNLAVDGKADYLVTGDSDLLVIEKIASTEIITFSDLFDRLT
jgi:putative PIN family toxin of toxin-antitoxin system